MVVRSAVVGAGVISRTHLSGIQENPRTELVGICDLDEEAANQRAREFGTLAVTDLSRLLDLDLDCLHICTPAQTHFELASRAIEKGVAVIVEKPATVTADEIEQLAALARENDVPATVVHNNLYNPAVRKVRRLIDEGELGDILGVDVIYSGLTPPDSENRGSWVFDLPGGEFEEGLPHPIYAALGTGGYPESEDAISAQTALSREYEDGFSYDQAQVQYVSESGTLCTVKILSDNRPQRLVIVHGTEQSVIVDRVNQSVYTIDEDHTASIVSRSMKSLDVSLAQFTSSAENAKMVLESQLDDSWEQQTTNNAHFAIFDEFVDAIESGGEVPVPLEESVWTIRIMEAVRDAARRSTSAGERETADAEADDAAASDGEAADAASGDADAAEDETSVTLGD